MPIDPSIALSGRPFQPLDFGQTLGQLMQFRGQQQQFEANRLTMDKVRRAEEDDRAIRTAIQRSGGDVDVAITDLERGGFAPVAFKLRDVVLGQREKEADTLKKRADATHTRMEQTANIVNGITPENFRESKRAVAAMVGDDMAAYLGDVYDKAVIDRVRTFGRTATDQIRADRDAATAAHQALTLERDKEKNAPEIFAKWTEAASKSLGNAQSQEDWAKRREVLAQGGPFAKQVLQQFDAEFSPEAAEKARAIGRPTNKQLQSKEVMSGGQRVQASFDPDTGDYFAPGSTTPLKDVTPAPPQVDPMVAELRAARLAEMQTRARQKFPDLSPVQVNTAMKLADDFTRDSKVYIERSQALASIQAGAKDPSAAGDLSLIFSYMKMLDPGSVVREAEQANAQNASGVPDQIRNLYNKVMTGERLNPTQRADFVKRAGMIYEGEKKRHDSILRTYTGRAKSLGLPAELVVMDYGTGQPAAESVAPPATTPAKKVNPFR